MFAHNQNTVQFQGLTLHFRNRTDPKDNKHYVTTSYVIEGKKDQFVYVIERQPNSNITEHFFEKFKPERANQHHLCVINFQCESGSSIYLPAGYKCYVLAQKPGVAIYGQHEGFEDESKLEIFETIPTKSGQDQIKPLPDGTKKLSEPIFLPPDTHGSKRKQDEKSLIELTLTMSDEPSAKRSSTSTPVKSTVPSQSFDARPMSLSDGKIELTRNTSTHKRASQLASNPSTTSLESEVLSKKIKTKQVVSTSSVTTRYTSIAEYARSYCKENNVDELSENNIKNFLSIASEYNKKNKTAENTIQYLLIDLDKSSLNKDNSECQNLFVFIIKLLDYMNTHKNKARDNANTTRYLSTILHRLGKLCNEHRLVYHTKINYSPPIQKILIRLESLSDFCDARDIANGLWGIAYITNAGIHFDETVAKSCAALLAILTRFKPTSQHIAMSIWSLGRLADAGFKFDDKIAKDCCTLIKQLLTQNPKAQEIANCFWSLGKLAQVGVKFNETFAQPCASLFIKLLDTMPNSTDIAHSFWGLARLSEYGMHLKDDITKYIEELLGKLEIKKMTSQNISMIFYALGQFAEAGIKFKHRDIIAKYCEMLLQQLLIQDPKTQEMANTMLALGKLAQSGISLSKPVIDHTSILVVKLLEKNPNTQDIAHCLSGLGRLVDAKIELDETVPQYCKALLTILLVKENKPNARDIADCIWGLGLLAAVPTLLSELMTEQIETLLVRLIDEKANAYDIACSIHGLGRMAEAGVFMKSSFSIYIETLIEKLLKMNADSIDIAECFLGLGQLSKAGIRFSEVVVQQCEILLTQLAANNANTHNIGNCFWGLGCLADAGVQFNETIANHCEGLLEQLLQPNVQPQEIANTFWALGRLSIAGIRFRKNVAIHCETLLKELTAEKFAKNLNTIDIGTTLWGLGRLAETDLHFNDTFYKYVNDLFARLGTVDASSQNIANSLWGIGNILLYAKPSSGINVTIMDHIQLALIVLTTKTTINAAAIRGSLEGIYNITQYWLKHGALQINNEPFNKSLLRLIDDSIISVSRSIKQTSRAIDQLFKTIYLVKQYSLSPKNINKCISYIRSLLKQRLSEHQVDRLQTVIDLLTLHLDSTTIAEFEAIIETKLSIARSAAVSSTSINADKQTTAASVALPSPVTTPQMKSLGIPVPAIDAPKRDYKIFNIREKSGIDALEKHVRSTQKDSFTYDRDTNKNRGKNLKLYAAEVALLGGQLGIFAADNIDEVNKIIAVYAGERLEQVDLEGTKEDIEKSAYYFQLGELYQGKGTVIDAKRLGDFTRMVNGAQIPNIKTSEETYRGVTNIYFRIRTPIQKWQQWFLDYGDDYLPNVDFLVFYMHTSDNWETKEERFTKLKSFYLPEIVSFDQKTCQDLRLNGNQFVVPTLFRAIMDDDVAALQKQLAQANLPLEEMLAYACNDQELLPYAEQQHLTPLMLACYLGREACIRALVKSGSDVHRCMLVAGCNALSLLIQGRAETALVEKIALEWLNTKDEIFTSDLFTRDKDELGILHYAIQRGSARLVDAILAKADSEKAVRLMYDRDEDKPMHANLESTILNNQFDILEVLFKHIPATLLREYINEGWILSENTIKQLSTTQLSQLQSVIQKYQHKCRGTDVLTRIRISDKAEKFEINLTETKDRTTLNPRVTPLSLFPQERGDQSMTTVQPKERTPTNTKRNGCE